MQILYDLRFSLKIDLEDISLLFFFFLITFKLIESLKVEGFTRIRMRVCIIFNL